MPEIILILENIRSVHNVGSIFRTADGFGVSKIFLTGFTPEPKDRFGRTRNDFHKTALGAENCIPWEKKEMSETITSLKKKGFKIYCLEQSSKSKPLQKLKIKNRSAFILGSETEGVEKETLKQCDGIFEIEMLGKKESFNVSVVAGLALYEITRGYFLKKQNN